MGMFDAERQQLGITTATATKPSATPKTSTPTKSMFADERAAISAPPKPAANINASGGVGSTSYGPTPSHAIEPPKPSPWQSLTDNPIVHGAIQGAKATLDDIQKPFQAVSTAVADTAGALSNLFGNHTEMGYDGKPFTASPSQSRNLVKDVGSILSHSNSDIPAQAWQGADPNPTKFPGTNLDTNKLFDTAFQSVGPGELLKPFSALKSALIGSKVGDALDAFDKAAPLALPPASPESLAAYAKRNGNVLPTNTEPILGHGDIYKPEPLALNESPQYNEIQRIKSQQTLGLPEASPQTISDFNRRNGNVLPTNTTPIIGKGGIAEPLGLPQGNYTAPTRLKVAGNNQTLDYVITKIKPEVMSIIEAPARRDLLISYLQKNLNIPATEIHNMPMSDLQELGQHVQAGLRNQMPQIATQVAAKYGHDLPSLLDGNVPNIADKAAKDAQSRVYGVPAPDVNIKRPDSFNVQHEGTAATPKQTLSFKREPKLSDLKASKETPQQMQQRYETQIKEANDRKQIADLSKPIIGRAAMPETKFKLVGNKATDTKPVTVAKLSDMRKSSDQIAATVERTKTPYNPKTDPVSVNERGFITTLKNSAKTPDELKPSLNATHTPLNNEDAVKQANKRVDKDVESAASYVMGNSKSTPEKVATAGRLIDEFNKSKNYQRATDIANKIGKELTEAGQTVQAASIYNRLTPEGALIRATRIVNKINESATRLSKPVEVTAKNAEDIQIAAEAIQKAGVSKERSSNVIDIMDKLKAKKDITEAERTEVQNFLKDAQQYVRTKEKPIKTPEPPKEMQDRRVKDNVISFLDKQEAAAQERRAARRGQMNSIPLDEYADMAIIAAARLAKGTFKVADISAELIKEFGDTIKPHLAGIFEKAHDLITQNAKRISKETISQAERIAENYINKNEANIHPHDVDFVRNLAKQVSSLSGTAKNAASQDLQAVLSSFEKAGIGRKLSAVQYIAMLLNPLTQVKNIAGNELLYRLSRLSRTLQTPFDMIVSGVTGKERTITSSSGPMTWENFFKPTSDFLNGLIQGGKAGARGVNIEGLTTTYDINGQAFRSKLNPLTYLEKALGATMKGFDYAAFNRATQQRLREMANLDAINKGVKGRQAVLDHIDKYMANLDDNIAAIAHEHGEILTLQNKSMLGDSLQAVRGGLNKLSTAGLSKNFGVGSIVLPFAKTPANLLMRAIDYSPAGFAKAILQTGQILLKADTDLTRADVIQSVTDAILGSGIAGAGIWLASKGVLKGESSSDVDVRDLEKLSGLTQYQLNATALQRMMSAMVSGNKDDINNAAKIQPGDTLYQYEWAQPSSIPLALGANIFKERQQSKINAIKGQQQDSLLKQSVDVSTGALNTLFNTSVLQGLQQAFNMPPGQSNIVKAFLTNIIKQAPSMFTPSMVGKVNQFNDNAVRETYSPDFMQSVLNPSQAKIPGQAQKLPQRVDTLGQKETTSNSISDLFLNPATRTTYSPNPEAKMVLDLMAETGDTSIAPRAVPKYVTGKDPVSNLNKKINLTGAQLTEYQTIVGQETLRLLGKVPDNLSTEAKVKRVTDILAQAGDVGRKAMRKELNLR